MNCCAVLLAACSQSSHSRRVGSRDPPHADAHNIYLILEFCDGGELFDRLHEQKGSRYSEAEAAKLVFKMTAAIG